MKKISTSYGVSQKMSGHGVVTVRRGPESTEEDPKRKDEPWKRPTFAEKTIHKRGDA